MAQATASVAGATLMQGVAVPAAPDLPQPRPARVADLAELMRLEEIFPGDRLSRRQLRHHITSPRALLRVLPAAGEAEPMLLGYSLLLLRHHSARARLYSLVVDPACRGQGIGARLLADAARVAAAAGCVGIQLEVRRDNASAIALYTRAGFRRTGLRPGYYDDGEAAVCMACELRSG